MSLADPYNGQLSANGRASEGVNGILRRVAALERGGGGGGGGGGTTIVGGSGSSIFERTYISHAGAALTVNAALSLPASARVYVAVGAFTINCEIREVVSVSAAVATLDVALAKTHAVADNVVFFMGDSVPASWFGLLGDGSLAGGGTDQTQTVIDAGYEAVDQGLALDFEGRIYALSSPVPIYDSHRFKRGTFVVSTAWPTSGGTNIADANNAMLMAQGRGARSLTITADAATDVITCSADPQIPVAGGDTNNIAVMFKGAALPGGLVNGKSYYVITSTISGNTFKVSATKGGATPVDITSAGSGGTVYTELNSLGKIYIDDIYLYGRDTLVNGISLSLQQPSYVRNFRADAFGRAAMVLCGQQADFQNLELLGNGTGIGFENAQMMYFDTLSLEGNTRDIHSKPTADIFYIGGGMANCRFDGVHHENAAASTTCFDFEGGQHGITISNALTNQSLDTQKFIWAHSGGGGERSGYVLENYVNVSATGQRPYVVDDDDRAQNELRVWHNASGTPNENRFYVDRWSAPSKTANDLYEERFPDMSLRPGGGFIGWGAQASGVESRVNRAGSAQVGDLDQWRSHDATWLGALASGVDSGGRIYTKAAVPADASVSAGEVFWAFDSTAAAPEVLFKGKDSAGTLFTKTVGSLGAASGEVLSGTYPAPTSNTSGAPQWGKIGLGGAPHATALFNVPGMSTGTADNGRAPTLRLGPEATAWDATAGSTPAGVFAPHLRMGFSGFTNGVNWRSGGYTTAQNDDPRLIGNDVFGFVGSEKATFFFGTYMPVSFNSKGLFVGHQVTIDVLKPTGTSPASFDNYNEGIAAVYDLRVKNKGSVSKAFESGMHLYQSDPARTGESHYHADAGPAAASGHWATLYENVDFADFDSYFTTQTLYKTSGAQGYTIASFGTRRLGTGIMLNSGSTIADEAAGESGFVRAMVLRAVGGDEIFCLDGFGQIGIGTNVTRNQSIYTSGLPARIVLGPTDGPAGTAASGGILFGDIYLYRAAADVLATNNAAFFQAGGMAIAGSGGVGTLQMAEQTITPIPGAGKARLYAIDHSGSTWLRLLDPAGTSGTPGIQFANDVYIAKLDANVLGTASPFTAPALNLSGTAGDGFLQFYEVQTFDPASPGASKIRLFASIESGNTVLKYIEGAGAGTVHTLATGAGGGPSGAAGGILGGTYPNPTSNTAGTPQWVGLGINGTAPATGLGITNSATGQSGTQGLFATTAGVVSINKTSGNFLQFYDTSTTAGTTAKFQVLLNADGSARIRFNDSGSGGGLGGNTTNIEFHKTWGANTLRVIQSGGGNANFDCTGTLTVGSTSTYGGALAAISGTLKVNNGLDIQSGNFQVNAGAISLTAVNGAGVVAFTEQTSAPVTPSANAVTHCYMKADKFVIQYNDAGTVKYRYLILTDTGTSGEAVWTYTTTAP